MLEHACQAAYQQYQEHFNAAITRFFDRPIMMLPAAISWSINMGWSARARIATVDPAAFASAQRVTRTRLATSPSGQLNRRAAAG